MPICLHHIGNQAFKIPEEFLCEHGKLWTDGRLKKTARAEKGKD